MHSHYDVPISGVCVAMMFNFCEKYSKNSTVNKIVTPFSRIFSPYVAGSQNVININTMIIVVGAIITCR